MATDLALRVLTSAENFEYIPSSPSLQVFTDRTPSQIVNIGNAPLLRPPADDSLDSLKAQLAAVTAKINDILDKGLSASTGCCDEPNNQNRFCQV